MQVDNKRAVLYVSSLGADPDPADMKSEASTTGSTTNVKTGRGTAKGKLMFCYIRLLVFFCLPLHT